MSLVGCACTVVSATQHLCRVGRRGGVDGQRPYISRVDGHHRDVEQLPCLPAQQHQPAALQRQRTACHVCCAAA